MESELRLIRDELKGLHDAVNQIVRGSRFAAPRFLFLEAGTISEEEVKEKLHAILNELGTDHTAALKKLRRYSELFFLEYLENRKGSDAVNPDDVLRLKLAIQCEQNHSPFQEFLFRLYQRDFRDRCREAVRAFDEAFGQADLIVLHLSCRARVAQAKRSADTFSDAQSRIRNIIVVGHAEGKHGEYGLNPKNGLLVVPASDAYEGLAEKIAAAYAFLAFSGNSACILKVDDDIRCLDPVRLLEDALPLARSCDYAGRVWHARYGFSRSWHLGKCEDPILNVKPYGLLADASYAEGPAYFLSPGAVHVLGKASVYLEQLFETEFGYEDLAVGKVLNHYGIMPVNYDPIRTGLLGSTDAWMMERAGLPPMNSGE